MRGSGAPRLQQRDPRSPAAPPSPDAIGIRTRLLELTVAAIVRWVPLKIVDGAELTAAAASR